MSMIKSRIEVDDKQLELLSARVAHAQSAVKQVAEDLGPFRNGADITRTALAAKLKSMYPKTTLSESVLQMIETGGRPIDLDEASQLIKWFQSIGQWVEETGGPKTAVEADDEETSE